ncbi:methylesterase 3-like [Hibiscus syriacus]|uniref:methylesterase 3-like n=1 Tax=Hibiscus syriacus TaxID=106335 RepID=UPI00192402F4|nr:methylesterase 3-like [Hibiscus syriacus]
MASLPIKEKVVLVAHSLGGLAISQAMEMFSQKISVAVFVTATMPGPTLNVSLLIRKMIIRTDYALNDQDSQMDNSCTYDDDGLPTIFTFGPMFLCSEVCQLSPPQVKHELLEKWKSMSDAEKESIEEAIESLKREVGGKIDGVVKEVVKLRSLFKGVMGGVEKKVG